MAEIQEIHHKNKRELEKQDIWEALESMTLMKRAASMLPTHQLSKDLGTGAKRRMSVNPAFGRMASIKKVVVKETEVIKEESSEGMTSDEEEDPMARLKLLEEELDEKLLEFRGVAGTLKGTAHGDVSKLLLDSSKENVNPDQETYGKLLALTGGPMYMIVFVVYA